MSLRKSSSIVSGQWQDDDETWLFPFSLLPPIEDESWRDKYVKSRWPLSYREKFLSCCTRRCICMGVRERTSWFFARIGLSHVSFLTLFPFFPFPLCFSRSSSTFSASPVLPSPVREIKQLKSAFAIRRKKQRRVSVYTRLFYRGALLYTWDLAVFPSFSFEDR